MWLMGLLIIYLSRIFGRIGGLVFAVAEFLNSILPALLPADELRRADSCSL
jgi:hypothetical protein